MKRNSEAETAERFEIGRWQALRAPVSPPEPRSLGYTGSSVPASRVKLIFFHSERLAQWQKLCLLAAFSMSVAFLVTGCAGQARTPPRCYNLVQNANLEKQGEAWRLPPFAKIEEPAGGIRTIVVEGVADGAIAQLIPRPAEISGLGVIAVGYARVELPHAIDPTDEDITAQLWQGSVNLVDGYTRNGSDFVSPYTRIHFSGREAASGEWKRFVTRAIPAAGARFLYPHFAFWAARLNHGVKLHMAGLALVAAPADDKGEPEVWAECPSLLAPSPVIESPTQRQWDESQAPDGTFDGFEMTGRREPPSRQLLQIGRAHV